jgi:hypothetical protein
MIVLSIPIRLWNSVCTKPGHSAITATPLECSSIAKPAEKFVTQDLCAL